MNSLPPSTDASSEAVAAFRSFNRFYTNRIGVLREGVHRSPYSLTEARIIFELAQGGVMETACRGARSGGATTVGLLPGLDRTDANGWVTVAIPTGLGEARNALVVRAADALVAVGGAWGTLSEIALAMRRGIPVAGVGTWELARGGMPDEAVLRTGSGAEAVEMAVAKLAQIRR